MAAANDLIRQLENHEASRQKALEAGLSPASPLWAEDTGSMLDRLSAGHIVWSELCGRRDGALREVIRVSDESTQQSPTTLDILNSVFWSARVFTGPHPFLKPNHSGSDPCGEEPVLRLFMESLERIGRNIGCAPYARPLDFLGPDRIAALLQTLMGSTKYPTRDSVRNARKAVIASRELSLSSEPGEAGLDI